MSETFSKIERGSVAVYVHYNRDVRKLAQYGDLVYHSRKLRYAVLYTEHEKVAELVERLQAEKFVKKAIPSYIKELDTDFVGILYRDEKENVLL